MKANLRSFDPGNGIAAGTHFYEPLAGHRLPHDPFKAIIAPRPIGWISTVSADGVANVAPYSFVAPICDKPPMLMVCSEGRKDTAANAEATGEFVWNMVPAALAAAMNRTGLPVASAIDEFDLADLAKAPSHLVRPPRVAASPASLECRLVEIRQVPTLDQSPANYWMIIGQVVGVHLSKEFLKDGRFDTSAVGAMARGGYRDEYFEAGADALRRMRRPEM